MLGLNVNCVTEPLGLECVAAVLEAEGHECCILDLRFTDITKGFAKIRQFAPELIGIQCDFTTERYRTISLARGVRAEAPGAAVVVGGHDASRDPEWFTYPAIDAVTIGDGEDVILDLVRACEKRETLESVPGLMVNSVNGPIYTAPIQASRNLDDLPLPARHLVREYSNRYYMSFSRPVALLETARGCPFRCNFCSVWKFHRGMYREKTPGRIIQDLEQIESPNVFITDDVFWVDAERSRELARAIVSTGARKHFFIQTRTDIIVRRPEIVELWKSCGNMTVFLGLEKLDDEGLKSVDKHNTAAHNERAIEILKDLGIPYSASFIVNPDWDREDFAKLRGWVEQVGAYNSAFTILTPLPGTSFWEEAQARLITRDWELFDLEHCVLPTKLSLEDFYEEYAGLWRHAMEVRRVSKGKLRTAAKMIGGLITGRVTLSALRRGLLAGQAMSKSSAFLEAHRRSREQTPQEECTMR